MPPPDDLPARVGRLEDRVGELERRERQQRSEWASERTSLLEAVKRVAADMTAALKPYESLATDVAALKAMNEKQLDLLKEAAEERGRRKQREEDEERKRKTRSLDLEETKVDADIAKAQLDARVRKVITIAALIGTLATALGTIIAAAVASHH